MNTQQILDAIEGVKDLKRRVGFLESLAVSANMDASSRGATLEGLSLKIKEALAGAGLATPELLRQMSDEQLIAVSGIGPAAVRQIRAVVGR